MEFLCFLRNGLSRKEPWAVFLYFNFFSMFQPGPGNWAYIHIPSKASTEYENGDLLQNDGTDNIPATSTSTNHVGICLDDKSSSDTTTDKILVAVPRDASAQCLADVSGTLTAAMVGRYFDLVDSETVNQAASAVDAVQLTKFISATKGLFWINTFGGFRDAV